MKDPLIASMAARLNRSHEDVERALQSFMGTLLDRLKAGGDAALPGLGTFNLDEGTVSFSPTDALVSAVDFRYGHGAATVEAEAAPTVAEVETPEPISPAAVEPDAPVADATDSAEIERPEENDWMPPVEADPDVDDAFLIDELAREALGADPDAVDPYVDAADLPEPDTSVAPPQSVVDEPLEVAMAAAVPAKAASGHAPTRKKRHRTTPHRDRGGFDIRWAIIPILLVVAAIAFFLLRPDGTDPIESGTVIASDSSQVAAADSTIALVAGDTTDPGEGAAPAQQTPPPVAPEPATFSISDSGYTLIAGSTTRRADAVRTAERLKSLGHPVAVLAYEDDELTRYRIGVGKFDTVGAANRARALIEDRLPEGTWVRRIRP